MLLPGLPLTAKPAVPFKATVPLVTAIVTTTGWLPASGSLTLTLPANVIGVLIFVVAVAGAVTVGALLTATTCTIAFASGELLPIPSLTLTVTTRSSDASAAVVGFCELLAYFSERNSASKSASRAGATGVMVSV